MVWRRSGRAGDAPGVSPFGGEKNRRLYFSGLIVFKALRAGKFSSSIFAGARLGRGRVCRAQGACCKRRPHLASDSALKTDRFAGGDNFGESIVFNALRAVNFAADSLTVDRRVAPRTLGEGTPRRGNHSLPRAMLRPQNHLRSSCRRRSRPIVGACDWPAHAGFSRPDPWPRWGSHDGPSRLTEGSLRPAISGASALARAANRRAGRGRGALREGAGSDIGVTAGSGFGTKECLARKSLAQILINGNKIQ
jgi:hypothetical protein